MCFYNPLFLYITYFSYLLFFHLKVVTTTGAIRMVLQRTLVSSSQKRAKNKAPVRKTPTRLQHATQRKPETLFLPCNSVEASKTSCRPVRCVTTCMLGFKCASVMPTKCYSILDHEPFLLCELVKLLYNDNLIILVHVATNFQI